MNRRFLCVYFPNWSINLVQRRLPAHAMHDGVLLITKINSQLTVTRACVKAKSVGIKEGTTLTLAKAFLPNATITDFNPIADFKTLYQLAVWGHSFSPLNGLDTDIVDLYKKKELAKLSPLSFGINLDITGTDRVHKGERTLVQRINKKVLEARLEAKIAIAPTLGAAWALSRFANERICIRDREALRDSLYPLPIEALRIESSAVNGLREVGIRTVDKLLELPRKSLAKRYGTRCLLRIDQALGEMPETVSRIPMPNHWAVYREYEYALSDHDRIVTEVLDILELLIKDLANVGRRGKYFILLLQGEDLWGAAYRLTKEFSILIASRNEKHIRLVLSPLIEKLELPGPIYLLGITSKDTEKVQSVQTDALRSTGAGNEAVNELINQLAAQVGEKNVCKVNFTNSYVPESSFQYSPLNQPSATAIEASDIRDRPSKLLQVPEEIAAIAALPDSPPKQITWKGIELKILKGLGPERISLPWFEVTDEEISSREYFKVEDQTGRWLWIYRSTENQRWFVHGLWI